jgi:6-phosphogluconate dehydrogenase (decarboxylating)
VHQIRAYLEAVEEITLAKLRSDKQKDAASLALLGSALDAAKAAWLLIPASSRTGLVPPPELEEYC